MSKKIRKPDYYDRFQCIAGACRDSCCIGWEIDVDEERRLEYRKVSGELGERLRTCIDWEEGHFILQGKEERCPFLNKDNLCDLIIGLGEESLCEICREHPRYYEWYDNLTEVGVGLCCEEAARLILESERLAAFVLEPQADHSEEPEFEENTDDDALEVLFHARETAFAILQNRNASIWNRLRQFLLYIEELQEALDFDNLDEVEESADYHRGMLSEEYSQSQNNSAEDHADAYRELLAFCRELEPMDEAWPKRLGELETMLSDSESFRKIESEMHSTLKEREYEYEHLAVYFVYRYFMKCRGDGDVYSRGYLAVFCILLIRLLDVLKFSKNHVLTKDDRAMNAKDCSKEIEYSEENLEVLAELFWEHGTEKIIAGL